MGSDCKLVLSDGTIKPCTRSTDTDGFDTVTCGTETFYVMSEDSNTVTMLAKYNLDVGNIVTLVQTPGICWYDEQVGSNVCQDGNTEEQATPIENPTGIQKYVEPSPSAYGVLAFSETAYWVASGTNYNLINNKLEATPMASAAEPTTYAFALLNPLFFKYVS